MPIPISKVKYGSYPSYFIHLLSLRVFYRISGRTLPNAVFALLIGGVPPIRMKSMLCNLYIAELLESYITFPETYPLKTSENRSGGTCYLTCTRPR